MNRRLAAAGILIIAAAASTAACGSGTSHPPNGTETIHGKLTGAAAEADKPLFHLTFTGPVGTSGTITLDGSNAAKGQRHSLSSNAGTLAVTLNSAGKNTSSNPALPKCAAAFASTVPFTVDGAKSTGKFADAKGTGTAVITFSGDMPHLKNGQCDEASNAEPVASTAVSTFTATARLTLK